MRRYAIARHTGAPSGDHFDIFLEQEQDLETWSVGMLDWQEPQPVQARAAHRKVYLEYEGPISGNRGLVKLCERGTYEVVQRDDSQLRVRLVPDGSAGRLVEFRRQGADWTIHAP